MSTERLFEQQTMVIEQTSTIVVPTKVILGPKLRRARESHRLSQIDIARRLRLRLDVIECLEKDEFSKLPAAVFVRGYLRSYAKLVHLPEDEVIQLFNRAIEPANDKEKDKDKHERIVVVKQYEEPRQKTFKDLPIRFLTYGIILGLIILVGLWWLGDHSKSTDKTTEKFLTQTQLEEMEQDQQALAAQHILANERVDLATPITQMLGIAEFDFPYSTDTNRFSTSKALSEEIIEAASEEQE